MSDANPLVLADSLESTLKRYIATTVPIHSRYPALQQSFWNALRGERLVNGPYIETIPDFQKGCPLRTLLMEQGGFMHDGLSALDDTILDRKLHLHQELALTKACRDGQNLVVATGTGSGKTETFLYPMVDLLLKDINFDQPGVRIILVYPMNALANDQLYFRIAPLLGKTLKSHGITFGRYTGQTKKSVSRQQVINEMLGNSKINDEFGDEGIPDNWLLTREEMLTTPPKVLVTNYAMLEHLLLLPANSSLFKYSALKALVLDEVHTYTGAQATEVAFLLRKLKNRLGVDYPLQFFATSASLGDSGDSDEKLRTFASHLFGEAVPEIVRGQREPHTELIGHGGVKFSLSATNWINISKAFSRFLHENPAIEDQDFWNLEGALEEYGVDADTFREADQKGMTLAVGLFHTLLKNQEICQTAEILQQGLIDFVKLSRSIFSSVDSETAVSALTGIIQLGMYAKSPINGFPLLPCRHHIIAGSIEGLSVIPANTPEGFERVKLAKHYTDSEGMYYPLLTCRQCGQPYFEGFEYKGRIINHRPNTQLRVNRRLFWLGKPTDVVTFDEEDDAETSQPPKWKSLKFDPVDGEVSEHGAVMAYEVDTQEDTQEKAQYLTHCAACNAKASGANAEVITRFYPGNESLSSVVTQKVLEALPAKAQEDLPMAGRKLLTFSDNRQDAAFFAPYFERTANDIAHRAAIVKVLEMAEEPLPFDTVARNIRAYWQKSKSFSYPTRDGKLNTSFENVKDLLTGKVVAEFCTPPGRRVSLESLGLVAVEYDQHKLGRVITALARDFSETVTESEVKELVYLFLEHIRRTKSIDEIPNSPDPEDGFIWGERYKGLRTFELESVTRNNQFAWMPKTGSNRHNRRTWYLIQQLGWEKETALNFLAAFWSYLEKSRLLIRSGPGKALDASAILLIKGTTDVFHQCKKCGLRQTHFVRNRCTAFGCNGEIEACSADTLTPERNHYLHSYLISHPLIARAREHTASLSTELRETIESDFHDQKVNILSCTTTMEVGVDLGELEAVVNLNVPPAIANYQQRTGRAGRRAQAAPFCVTIARNSHYDRVVFDDFEGYLKKSPADPVIHLTNPTIFQRHQLSIILSHFFRETISSTQLRAPRLKDLFGDSLEKDFHLVFRKRVQAWLESDNGRDALNEAEVLFNGLPEDDQNRLSGRLIPLIELLPDEMERFAAEVNERWHRYSGHINQAKQLINSDQESLGSRQLTRWTNQRDTYMEQFLVTQLSEKGLIPTYSFPVHSLTLEVTKEAKKYDYQQRNADIALSRDASMGISEYAPGAEVIANGRIWRSAGLAYSPKDFMPTEYVVVCRECAHTNIADDYDDVDKNCTNCRRPLYDKPMPFVKPKGFITALKESRGKDPSSVRKRAIPADEARLIVVPPRDSYQDTDHGSIQKVFMPSQGEENLNGRLFILNRGVGKQGYYRCDYCNYMVAVDNCERGLPPRTHDHPETGTICKGKINGKKKMGLAHEFRTDVAIFRIAKPVPVPATIPVDEQSDYLNNIGITLSEAFRMAVVKLLEIPASEIRCTYRYDSSALEIIAYDGVPGGAGYVQRIFDSVSVQALLDGTISALQCSKQCDSACTSCLCDYSNQRHWDAFERLPVIDFISKLAAEFEIKHPVQKLGAILETCSSALALSEEWAKYKELMLVLPQLADEHFEAYEKIAWLISLINQGVQVSVLVTSALPDKFKHTSSGYRRVIQYLKPYIVDGSLLIAHLDGLNESDRFMVPFAITNPGQAGKLWYSNYPLEVLTDLKIVGDTFSLSESVNSDMVKLLATTVRNHRYDANYFEKRQPVLLHKYRAGEPRDLSQVFESLNSAYIEKLHIRDPYIITHNSKHRLEELMDTIQALSSQIKEIQVDCRLTSPDDDYREYEKELKSILASYARTVHVNVYGHRQKKDFHDRRITATKIDDDGSSESICYELSGGVSHLMNDDFETAVTIYKPEQFGR